MDFETWKSQSKEMTVAEFNEHIGDEDIDIDEGTIAVVVFPFNMIIQRKADGYHLRIGNMQYSEKNTAISEMQRLLYEYSNGEHFEYEEDN